jgi:hypothetical protein
MQFQTTVLLRIWCFNSHSSREKLKKANCRLIMCVQLRNPALPPQISFFIKAIARVRCIARLKRATVHFAGMCSKPSSPLLYFADQPERLLVLSAPSLQVHRVQACQSLAIERASACASAQRLTLSNDPAALHVYVESL